MTTRKGVLNMNKMRWISTFATSAFLVTILSGCGSTNGTQTNSPNSNSSNQSGSEPTLILATSADYKPYEFHDTSGGQDKIIGFDIDVANVIAQQLHFKIKIQDMDFNGLIGSLQSKRADFVIAGMTPTD